MITFIGVNSKPVADVLVKIQVDSTLIVVKPTSFVIKYSSPITNVDAWKNINQAITFRAENGATSTTARVVCVATTKNTM